MIRLLVILLVAGCTCCAVGQESALQQGLQSLMEQQSEDGAWHSQHYGTMKQGAALTTLVLYSVSHVSPELREPYQAQIEAAFDFLKPGLDASGFVVNPEGSEDYPVYCTAMLLVACRKLELPLDQESQDRMVDYLIRSQVAETRGFDADHLEYGGWDVLGPDTRAGKTSGTNVSATCYVTEALNQFNDRDDVQNSLQRATRWLDRIAKRTSDGGFFFTPKLDSTNNKAGWMDDQFREPKSYGTATCDGLRIFDYCDNRDRNVRFEVAVQWLAKHQMAISVPGFGEKPEEQGWQASLRFYYFSTLAKSLPMLPDDLAEDFQQSLSKEIAVLQREDGLWQNDAALMREDDPIIATSFAVQALGCVESLQDKARSQ